MPCVKQVTDFSPAVPDDEPITGRSDGPMELLIALAALIALSVLALRFGQDSTLRIVSEEELFSHHGLSWTSTTDYR